MRWREWRERRGLTQTELAARSGVERTVLSRIEHDKRRVTIDVFTRLADALDLTPDERLEALRAA